jgi:hypothetical protein
MDTTYRWDAPITLPGRTDRARRASACRLFRLIALVATAAMAICGPSTRASEGMSSREYELKAAFVYNFTKFIEWPAPSFASVTAPLVMGVLGETPLESELAELMRDRSVNGRAILLKKVASAADALSTHLLFVSVSAETQFASWHGEIESMPVVTVGESHSFIEHGGTINFVLQDGKVRFEINPVRVERNGIRISAQLQKLALNARRDVP